MHRRIRGATFLAACLAAGLVALPAGSARAAGVVVVDARGSTIGDFLGYGGSDAFVLYPVSGGQTILRLAQRGATAGLQFASPAGNLEPTLYFESHDCTGTPYLPIYHPGGYPTLLFRPSWGTAKPLLYVADSVQPVLVTPHSKVQTRSHACLAGAGATRLWRASAPPIDMNSLFTPPFQVVSAP